MLAPAPVVEPNRDLVVPVGESVGLHHDRVTDDAFDREATPFDVGGHVLDRDPFPVGGHPQHQLLDDAQ